MCSSLTSYRHCPLQLVVWGNAPTTRTATDRIVSFPGQRRRKPEQRLRLFKQLDTKELIHQVWCGASSSTQHPLYIAQLTHRVSTSTG